LLRGYVLIKMRRDFRGGGNGPIKTGLWGSEKNPLVDRRWPGNGGHRTRKVPGDPPHPHQSRCQGLYRPWSSLGKGDCRRVEGEDSRTVAAYCTVSQKELAGDIGEKRMQQRREFVRGKKSQGSEFSISAKQRKGMPKRIRSGSEIIQNPEKNLRSKFVSGGGLKKKRLGRGR